MSHRFRATSTVAVVFALLCPALAAAADEREQASVEGSAPEGLSEADWKSLRSAVETSRYRAVEFSDGYRSTNPGQQWVTEFDGSGFLTTPKHLTWTWGLRLENYGWEGSPRASVDHPEVMAEGGTVTYQWDSTLAEWFINDEKGLEHGYTVSKRPEDARGPLELRLHVLGGLQPAVSSSGLDVHFLDAEGHTAVTYSGLCVFGADGREVSARFDTTDRDLRLVVHEQDAIYPLTIDPIAQQAYLKASNTNAGDAFGYSVSVSGNTVVVGAPDENSNASGVNGNQNNNSAVDAGAAYVFVRNGSTWSQQAYLKASNSDSDDRFGESVSISGDTIVVGAVQESSDATGVDGAQSNNNAPKSGAAYVFVRTGSAWSQQAYLKASNTGASDSFGLSVAVSGDLVAVGAYLESSNATGIGGDESSNTFGNAGAAYVFRRTGSVWSQEAYLKASNTGPDDRFGYSISASGDTVVVGAPLEDSSATGVNGDEASNGSSKSGAVYVFVHNGSSWSQEAYLKASNTDINDWFGNAVSIGDDTIVVGARHESSVAVGVDGNQASNGAASSGAAYVFGRVGTVWAQEAYLKASNTDPDDRFGYVVSVSGDTVVVGARLEDSDSTGVNGVQTSNHFQNAGAAYVFQRHGSNWSPFAYLKSFNTGVNDQLGHAAAVSGDLVVLGAPLESSNAKGVNGYPHINSAHQSGAAYVYEVGSWIDLGYGQEGTGGLTPTLTGTGTLLGGSPASLSLSGGLPNSTAHLILGLSRVDLLFSGGLLIPSPQVLLIGIPLSASGGFAINATLPASVPSGLCFHVQCWVEDPLAPGGLAASNGLKGGSD